MKEKLKEDLLITALQFIATHPPKGLNVPYLVICAGCGRLEEVDTLLKNFKRED